MADEKEGVKAAPKVEPDHVDVTAYRAKLVGRVAGRWMAAASTQIGDPAVVRVISNLAFQPSNVVAYERAVDMREEHEKTRQLITEKLATLPQREDLINARDETIRELSNQIANLQLQLETTAAELAKSRELEACTNRLCDKIRLENEETRRCVNGEVADLRAYLSKFAPHKRFFRVTFGILCFFSVALILYSSFGMRIVDPFWAAIGLGLSAATLIVIYFGMKDTE
jgi:hypothetical protein